MPTLITGGPLIFTSLGDLRSSFVVESMKKSKQAAAHHRTTERHRARNGAAPLYTRWQWVIKPNRRRRITVKRVHSSLFHSKGCSRGFRLVSEIPLDPTRSHWTLSSRLLLGVDILRRSCVAPLATRVLGAIGRSPASFLRVFLAKVVY